MVTCTQVCEHRCYASLARNTQPRQSRSAHCASTQAPHSTQRNFMSCEHCWCTAVRTRTCEVVAGNIEELERQGGPLGWDGACETHALATKPLQRSGHHAPQAITQDKRLTRYDDVTFMAQQHLSLPAHTSDAPRYPRSLVYACLQINSLACLAPYTTKSFARAHVAMSRHSGRRAQHVQGDA